MPRLLKINIAFTCILIFQFIFSSYKTPVNVPRAINSQEGFALVELFTSEGCSSCPPADEAVGRLNGWKKNVFVLSYHVDYWNYLGWKDVFSNAAYSSRQQKYGDLFHLSSIYTPQVVVNGKVQFVGSDETKLRETIGHDLNETPKTELQIKVQPLNANQLAVSWTTHPQSDLQINLALAQNFTKDFIQRGENKGQNLNHYFTVRDFQSMTADDGIRDGHSDNARRIAIIRFYRNCFFTESKNG